jgi:TolB-like protein/DNA-binding winged helix-turn-helix (wHTH) protein/Tfp pilus assembly protein PilF
MLKRKKIYLLGDFALDPERRLLTLQGTPIHLTHKPFRVLLYLIEHRDRVVKRSELMDRFWEGRDVYDESLHKAVGMIRKALDDRAEQVQFIETFYGEGYRYVGPFEEQFDLDGAQRNGNLIEAATPDVTKQPSDGYQAVTIDPEDTPTASKSHAGGVEPQGTKRLFLVAVTTVAVVVAVIILLAWRSRVLQAEGSSQPSTSVAVLPFRNLTGDPANEYLSDGITDHLINTLANVEGLKVSARGSSFTFKGQEVDPREAGKELGVGAVVQGSVVKGERGLRIEARLVSIADGRVLWAKGTSERAPGEVFALQDELEHNVLAGMNMDKRAEGERRLARRYTENEGAYQAYLKGRYQYYLRTPEGLSRSLEYFRDAIRLDPNYALAYAGMADSHSMSVWFINPPPGDATEKAKAAANRALALDEGLAEAHAAMARVYNLTWAPADSARELDRALELAPDNAEAHHFYAYTLLALGQAGRAVAEIRRARELDPLSIVMNVDVGEVLLYARRYDEAAAALRHAIEMDPSRENAHWDLAVALQQQGKDDEAFEEYVRAATLNGATIYGAHPEVINSLRETYARAGLPGLWRQMMEQTVEKARSGYIPPYYLATSCAQAGERDRAFAYLEQAYRERSPLLFSLQFEPLLDGLRDDPRFAALAARAGL